MGIRHLSISSKARVQHQSSHPFLGHWEGREPHRQFGGLLQGREQLPIPALAAALSQASAHSGVSQAAIYVLCLASLLQIPNGPLVRVKGSSDWFGPWLEPREAGCSLPQFSYLQMERVTPPHDLISRPFTRNSQDLTSHLWGP